MIFWTSVEGRLAGDERLRVYIAAREGRIWRTSMDAKGHPCSQDEFLWQLGSNRDVKRRPSGTGSGLLDAAVAQVEDYMAGFQLEFDLPLEFDGTPFQVDVWKALTRVPFGATSAYGDIAEAIGRPAAMRAVGQATGRNHLCLIVPCHRIVAAGGKLGGFSGGISVKKALLAHEAAILANRRESLEAAAERASLSV
jgi:O-6-methylguanine DNA methyltransferase